MNRELPKKGQRIWVQYGYDMLKAKYMGNGIAVLKGVVMHGTIVNMRDPRNRIWFPRRGWFI